MKKEKPKDNKLSNVFKIIISIFILIAILTLFLLCINGKGDLIQNKNLISVNKEYNQLYEDCIEEAKKYDKILEENSIKDIYNYITVDLDNEVLYRTPILDYIFENLFKKANANEKFNLFYLYYYNLSCLEEEYTEYFSAKYNLQWLNLNFNGYDVNSLEGIAKIEDRPILQNTLINMKLNGLKMINNYPKMEAVIDYDVLLEKFGDVLDEDYINFCNLMKESQTVILNPGGVSFNYVGEIWYLHNFEDFIRNCNNIYLKGAAQDIYEQNLALFLGQYDSNLFYSDSETYSIYDNFFIATESYLNQFPDDYTSILLKEVLEIIEENEGKDIIDKINSKINLFISNAEWLPKGPTIDSSSSSDIFEYIN